MPSYPSDEKRAHSSDEKHDVVADEKAIPQKVLKHSRQHDADEAMKAFGEGVERIEIDEATNSRLRRKIDMNLLPVRPCPHSIYRKAPCHTSFVLTKRDEFRLCVLCMD